jgi:hypothetical protein
MPLLTTAALYLALIAFGLIFVPRYFGIGAVPPDAPPALIAFLRIFAGPCLGIAVLNWRARRRAVSDLDDIVLANIIGFGCVTLMDVWGVASGEARPIAKAFLGVHLLFTLAFIAAGRAASRQTAEGTQ